MTLMCLAPGTAAIRWNAMSNFVFELNPEGVRELLTSPEMAAVCTEFAEAVKDSSGDGAEISVYTGQNRVNASIYQPKDRFDNKLLKALGEVAKND